jgi:hypothetical protein
MLWRVEPAGWMFLVIIAIFNLLFDFFAVIGPTTTFSDVALSFLVNGVILIYALLPGVKEAFGVASV